jgi:predicted ABC-type ATPase
LARLSPSLAIQRVKKRVENGGHNIPSDVIERRYHRGLENLFNIYIPICDRWLVFDNMDLIPEIIAQGDKFGEFVSNSEIWSTLKSNIIMNDKVNIENINLAERIRLGVQKA